MRIFKAFFKICIKNKGTFILYTVIFLGLTLIVAGQENDYSVDKFESSSVKLAIFDHDNSDLSQSLTKYITSVHEQIDIDEDIDSIRDNIYTRNVEYVIIINEGFEKNISSFEKVENNNYITAYKLPSSISAQFVDLTVNNFITTFNAYTIAGLSKDEAYKKTLESITTELDINFNNNKEVDTTPKIHYFYLYLAYVLIAIIIESITPILISFNSLEIKKRMALSNMSQLKINLLLALSASFVAILLLVFYVIVSFLIYGSELTNIEGLFRIGNAFIYTCICLAFTFLLSNLTPNKNFVGMFANIIGLSSSFLCGIFVPRQFLSEGVINAGRFFPAYWYVNVEEALLDYSSDSINTILTGYGVQFLFFVAILVIGLIVAKKRTER